MHRTIEAILTLTLLLVMLAPSSASDIDVTGGWSPSIGSADLQAGAGSDLWSTYESPADAALLTVYNTVGYDWRVDVRRDSASWQEDLALSVRRTGTGEALGPIIGGEAYQLIDGVDRFLFWGWYDFSGVPLQYRLEGMSLQVPPGTYSTTITYTVVDII